MSVFDEKKIQVLKSVRERWKNSLCEILKEKKKVFLENEKNHVSDFTIQEIEKYAKNIEEYIYDNTYTIKKIKDIQIINYKIKKIFEFESLEKHKFYNLQSYIKSINYIFSLLIFLPYLKIPKNYNDLFKLTENELSSFSTHSLWLKEFLEKQIKSKNIFFEKTINNGGIFSCPKCKSYQIEMEEKQTRSSDEPMTIFCKCEECETTFIK